VNIDVMEIKPVRSLIFFEVEYLKNGAS